MRIWFLGLVMITYSLCCLRDAWVIQQRQRKILFAFAALQKDMLAPENRRQALGIALTMFALTWAFGLYFILPYFHHAK